MSTTCPFCNATVSRAGAPCPRCGELVPARAGEAPASATANGETAPLPAPPSGWTNRQVGLTVLGLMAFAAAVGLGYALKTVEWRRSHDKPEEERAPVSVVHPADLPGVGYLPDDVQVIAGVRVAAARTSEPIRTALTALGISIDDAGRVLGVPADDVDHVLVAASLKALPPRVTVVLRARRPISAEAVRTALHAGRSSEHNGKTLFEVKPRSKGPDGLIWFADDRTIVGGLVREHFDQLPRERNPFIGRFPEPLPGLFRDRVEAGALAWAVAHVEPDDPTQNLLVGFLPIAAEERPALKGLRDLAISLWAEGADVRLAANVRGRDAAANDRLGDAVERSLGAIGVVVNERSSDRGWLRLTAKEDAKALAKWLNRAKSEKGP
jgi:hypothetical protein